MQKRSAWVCWVFVALLALSASVDGQTNQDLLRKSIKANLVFEVSRQHPGRLLVFLHLVNLTDAELSWSTNPSPGNLELIDPEGKPAAPPPGGWLLSSIGGAGVFTLPAGSRMDLLISTDWRHDDPKGSYVLGAGDHIWFIPKDKVGSYTVRVRFPGVFPTPSEKSFVQKPWNLFEVPPQKIVISPSAD